MLPRGPAGRRPSPVLVRHHRRAALRDGDRRPRRARDLRVPDARRRRLGRLGGGLLGGRLRRRQLVAFGDLALAAGLALGEAAFFGLFFGAAFLAGDFFGAAL